MALETASYISQLTATNPTTSDSVAQGDDHLRMLKTVLKTQFSGLTGTTAVSSSEAELNILDGVTSTAAELNILDGVTSTAAELNILDGVTSTAAELNILDGVTSTAAELNILDGVTSTATELNYNDVTTLGTVENSKAVTATSGGVVNFVDKVAQRVELKDYAETYNASSGSGSTTLDLSTGNVFQHTASGGNVTFVFSNPPGSGNGGSFTLKWIQDSSNRTITWPASVDWAGGSAPSVTSGSAKVDIYTFFTVDGGTIWYGFQAGADLG